MVEDSIGSSKTFVTSTITTYVGLVSCDLFSGFLKKYQMQKEEVETTILKILEVIYSLAISNLLCLHGF